MSLGWRLWGFESGTLNAWGGGEHFKYIWNILQILLKYIWNTLEIHAFGAGIGLERGKLNAWGGGEHPKYIWNIF